MLTFEQFKATRKHQEETDACNESYTYFSNWWIVLFKDKFSTGSEDFDTLEEAEAQLYDFYCDEMKATEGY